MRGGCICGRVRYEVRGQPLMAIVCHCRTCQKRTGSAFSMSLIVMRPDFVLVRRGTATRELPGASGQINVQHFCHHCLARTHSEPVASPEVSYVRPGTLDDPMQISPVAQIWVKSARPSGILDGLQSFDKNMTQGKMPALIRAWRAAHPLGNGN